MQNLTKEMLRDIKQARYRYADDALSKDGPPLISDGSIGAYGRKLQELYEAALKNIIEDIFATEKKALSSLADIPSDSYFSELTREMLVLTRRELQLLDEKILNQLRPYTNTANARVMTGKYDLISELVCRKTRQLKEELRLEIKRQTGTAPIINNTINNYAPVDTLNQGKNISNTQNKTKVHSQKPGLLEKISLRFGILATVLTIIESFTGWLSPYLKKITGWFFA